MAAALICLLLPLSLGATWGWGSARALGLFAAAAVLSALSAHVVGAVPRAHTAAATGMNANIRTIGGAIGAAIIATVLGSAGSAE